MQRYDYNCETARMTHSPDGDFVYYAAVATLEAENAALEAENAALCEELAKAKQNARRYEHLLALFGSAAL